MEKTAIFFRKKKKELKMNIDEEKNYKKPNMKSRLKTKGYANRYSLPKYVQYSHLLSKGGEK